MSRTWQQVDIFGMQDRRKQGRAKPWIVRWRVDGHQRTRAFRTRSEGDRYRAGLLRAVETGDQFDARTGEPVGWRPDRRADLTIDRWARRWLAEQWPEWQPRTRASAIEALSRFVALAVAEDAGEAPVGLRLYLKHALAPGAETEEAHPCHAWISRHSYRLADLDKEVLAVVDSRLGLGVEGRPVSPSTAARWRKVSKACIRRAVELDVLAADPWPPAPRGRNARKAVRLRRSIDVRALPDPETVELILRAIPSHQPASRAYQLMTACVYYAGLRPSEVVVLRRRALALPRERGRWGRIDVREADTLEPEPGEPKTGPRSVPIPPELVSMLTEWASEHALADDDFLFRTRFGAAPTTSNWNRAWRRALDSQGLHHWRIYDCRHAAATLWLASGAPLGEVARRLGHTVETLVSTYVGALKGDEQLTNMRIETALHSRHASQAA